MKKKPSVKSPDRKPVPHPHGGALVPGAGGGPQPGSGRPRSVIKAAVREGLAEQISVLTEIVDDELSRESDRIRAIDLMAKYGLCTKGGWDREDVIAFTQELGAAVSIRIADQEVLEALKKDWVAILPKHSR